MFGTPYVIARDPKLGKILKGGLGALGVGQMWFDETERDKEKPDYATAKIVEYKGQWIDS